MVHSYPGFNTAYGSMATARPSLLATNNSGSGRISQVPGLNALAQPAQIEAATATKAQANTGDSEVSGDQANDLLKGGIRSRQVQAIALLQLPNMAGLLTEQVKRGLTKLSSSQSEEESKNGLIGSLWDGAKATLGSEETGRAWLDPRNLIGLHKEASSGQLRQSLADSQNGVIILESLAKRIAAGDESALPKYLEQYEKVTGAPLNPEELAKTQPSAVIDQTKIAKQVATYKDSQHLGQEIIKDVAAGTVAAGAIALAPVTGGTSLLAVAAGAGALTRVTLTTANEFTASDDKFEVNWLAEAGKGAMDGGMVVFGEGLANVAGRAMAGRVGATVATESLEQGAGAVAKTAASNTLANAGKTTGSRFLGQNFAGYSLVPGTSMGQALLVRGTGVAVAGSVEGGSLGFVNTKLDGKSWREALQAGAMGAVAGVGFRGVGEGLARGLPAAFSSGSTQGMSGLSKRVASQAPSSETVNVAPDKLAMAESTASPASAHDVGTPATSSPREEPHLTETPSAETTPGETTTNPSASDGQATESVAIGQPEAVAQQAVAQAIKQKLASLDETQLKALTLDHFKQLIKEVDPEGLHTKSVLWRIELYKYGRGKKVAQTPDGLTQFLKNAYTPGNEGVFQLADQMISDLRQLRQGVQTPVVQPEPAAQANPLGQQPATNAVKPETVSTSPDTPAPETVNPETTSASPETPASETANPEIANASAGGALAPVFQAKEADLGLLNAYQDLAELAPHSDARHYLSLMGNGKLSLGEAKGRMFQDLVDHQYDQIRVADYPMTPQDSTAAIQVAQKDTAQIQVKPQNGWNYRFSKAQTFPSAEADRVISLNVNADPRLIQALDHLIDSGELPAYYKTPTSLQDWQQRHDPITLYVKGDLPEAARNELVRITQPYVRSGGDVLLGETLAPGVSTLTYPKTSEMKALIAEATELDPVLGQVLTREFTDKSSRTLNASAGQFEAGRRVVDAYRQWGQEAKGSTVMHPDQRSDAHNILTGHDPLDESTVEIPAQTIAEPAEPMIDLDRELFEATHGKPAPDTRTVNETVKLNKVDPSQPSTSSMTLDEWATYKREFGMNPAKFDQQVDTLRATGKHDVASATKEVIKQEINKRFDKAEQFLPNNFWLTLQKKGWNDRINAWGTGFALKDKSPQGVAADLRRKFLNPNNDQAVPIWDSKNVKANEYLTFRVFADN